MVASYCQWFLLLGLLGLAGLYGWYRWRKRSKAKQAQAPTVKAVATPSAHKLRVAKDAGEQSERNFDAQAQQQAQAMAEGEIEDELAAMKARLDK